jgi:outer membrane protein OmpA-like peptidoglycan-associated protein
MNIGSLYTRIFLTVVILGMVGCATPPKELVDARKSYKAASEGEAQKYAPADLRTAEKTLGLAEQSFDAEGDVPQTVALAYSAQRQTEQAQVAADIFQLKKKKEALKKEYFALSESARSDAMKKLSKTQDELEETRRFAKETAAELEEKRSALKSQEQNLEEQAAKLEAARKAGELTEAQLRKQNAELEKKQQMIAQKKSELETERKLRKEAEARLEKAMNRLSKIAQIEEKNDTTVITLGGEVVFKSGEATLLPSAREKLNQVADVLLEKRGKQITVEGHTDSQGSDSYNRELSQKRADAVRSHLVSQEIASDRIKAVGQGETQPVSSNENPTGRAKNRRVEIIIQNTPQG